MLERQLVLILLFINLSSRSTTQICENNWNRRNVGVKRADQRTEQNRGWSEGKCSEEIGEEYVEMGRSHGKNGR